jgi:uncharacterized protein YciI
MAYFIITCVDIPGGLDKRMGLRPEHLEYLASQKDILRLAGPLLDENDSPIGSMLLVETADRAGADAFAANDPYAKGGLFQSATIAAWRKSIGEIS